MQDCASIHARREKLPPNGYALHPPHVWARSVHVHAYLLWPAAPLCSAEKASFKEPHLITARHKISSVSKRSSSIPARGQARADVNVHTAQGGGCPRKLVQAVHRRLQLTSSRIGVDRGNHVQCGTNRLCPRTLPCCAKCAQLNDAPRNTPSLSCFGLGVGVTGGDMRNFTHNCIDDVSVIL